MSDDSLKEKARLIGVKASAIDSGAAEAVFGHTYWGPYAPFCQDTPHLFEPFLDLPDPAPLRSLATSVNEACKLLVYQTDIDDYPDNGDDTYTAKPEFDAIDLIAGETSNWIGDAADSFHKVIAVPAKRIVPNQFWALRSLKVALEGEAAMWEAAKKTVHGIADSTLNALEHVEEKGPVGWSFGMTVLTSVVSIGLALAAPVSGGATLSLALTVYGAATSIKSGADEIAKATKASGDSPQEIIESMRKAMGELVADLKTSEQQIQTGLKSLADNVGNRVFHFAEPSLVSNPDFTGHV